ncbi:hypothetical protein G6F31_019969 [Rhizopus arrhizus]|nr:hypothetical protein G6F31_019969 [Rhizopus arrhizus]
MDRGVVDALIALPERTRFMKGLYAWPIQRPAPVPPGAGRPDRVHDLALAAGQPGRCGLRRAGHVICRLSGR